MEWNGIQWDGMGWDGMEWNGYQGKGGAFSVKLSWDQNEQRHLPLEGWAVLCPLSQLLGTFSVHSALQGWDELKS